MGFFLIQESKGGTLLAHTNPKTCDGVTGPAGGVGIVSDTNPVGILDSILKSIKIKVSNSNNNRETIYVFYTSHQKNQGEN